MDAIGAHHHVERGFAAVLEPQRHACIVLRERLQPLFELDVFEREVLGQRVDDVGAVDGDLRRAVLFFGDVAHAQARGLLARVPVAADAKGRARTAFANCRARAQAVDGAHHVGREVDVRAHAREALGLLEHRDVMALLTQSDGGGQSAHAAAGNTDLQTAHGLLLQLRCTHCSARTLRAQPL
ncbi:hypothetical protein FQZ97_903430 [compost metagenome]